MKLPYLLPRTRVKICGLVRPEDAFAAARLGADALGLVFYPPSPRHVNLERAVEIAAALPPFVTLVGLFVDPEPAEVLDVLDRVPIDLLQFHGDETPEQCARYRMPYIKALRVRPGVSPLPAMSAYAGARGILLDAFDEAARGGTGQAFDWTLIPPEVAGSVILAGGLDPGNVATALAAVRPYALDVSSGVESAKGIKDAGKMAAFLREVQLFDDRQHVASL